MTLLACAIACTLVQNFMNTWNAYEREQHKVNILSLLLRLDEDYAR